MSEVTELDSKHSAEVTAGVADRRRPGRRPEVSPELIPMLRGHEADISFDDDDADQTAALRGLVMGVLISAPIWAAIAYVGHLLLSR